MRVLFVHPFFLNQSALEARWRTPYPPLGLLYLAAAARKAGHDVALFDGTFAGSEEAFDAALNQARPDAVCFGSLMTLRPAALRLAQRARAAGAFTVVGGPDATAKPEAYLSVMDVAALGEGEPALTELLAACAGGESADSIPGLAYRSADGTTRRTGTRAPIADLNRLPLPARDLVDFDPYFAVWREAHGYTSLTLAASRGCPFGCEHCANAAAGPHWRVRAPENVAAEMRLLEARYGPDRFRLVDDLDGLGREWLMALADAMQSAGVTTPYEGLRLHMGLGDLPMLTREKELCAERNAWIPKAAPHPHAPPALAASELQMRWREARLPEGATLAEPCPT
jgi:anaerobic magnesium-protoporphyrin IX monomethyl ester cyclase